MAAVDGLRCPVFVRLELASFDVAGVLLNVGVPLLGKVIQRKIAETGQTGTQAPQSMHSTGSMNSWSTCSNPGRPSSYCVSFFGWMQSTGQTSTHAVSLVPMEGSAIMNATV